MLFNQKPLVEVIFIKSLKKTSQLRAITREPITRKLMLIEDKFILD